MKQLRNLLPAMLLALLAWNCQKEEATILEPESVVETEIKAFEGRRTVALEEVPDIEGFLSSGLSKRKGYTFKKDHGTASDMVITPFGQIPLEDILEVTDTLGNFNYTFRILPSSYIGNRFYNLVVHKKEGEKGVSAFVVEYEMNQDYAQDYMAKTTDFGQFTGKVRTYGFEAFLDTQDKRAVTSKACEEENTPQNLEPCEEYEIENGEPNDDLPPPNDPVDDGPGDGGGNGDLDGDGPGGGGGGDPEVICAPGGLYVTDCGGSNSDVLHAAGSCKGPNKMGANFYMQYNCSDGSTNYQDLKAGDCSDGGAGPVGIAPVPFNKIALSLGLDFVQQQWLEANCEQKNDLYQFLNAHLDEEGDWRTDAKDFAREAVDAWMEGAEVNLEDKIINNLTGKAKCVYNQLQATNLNEPGIIQSTYISFDSGLTYNDFHLSYGEGPLPGNNAGRTQAVTNSYYTITLDEDKTANRSALEVANTIVHESIHALLLKHQFGDGSDSFLEIFSNYIEQTTGLNDLHHSIMRDKYILPMANALALYDGNKEESFIYESLALSGIAASLTAQQQSDFVFAVEYIRARSGLNCE
nr:hypothetical protein [uncultured Allomuricauda sp.]